MLFYFCLRFNNMFGNLCFNLHDQAYCFEALCMYIPDYVTKVILFPHLSVLLYLGLWLIESNCEDLVNECCFEVETAFCFLVFIVKAGLFACFGQSCCQISSSCSKACTYSLIQSFSMLILKSDTAFLYNVFIGQSVAYILVRVLQI